MPLTNTTISFSCKHISYISQIIFIQEFSSPTLEIQCQKKIIIIWLQSKMSRNIPFSNKCHGSLLSVNCTHNSTLQNILTMRYFVLNFIKHYLEQQEQCYQTLASFEPTVQGVYFFLTQLGALEQLLWFLKCQLNESLPTKWLLLTFQPKPCCFCKSLYAFILRIGLSCKDVTVYHILFCTVTQKYACAC